MKDHKNPPKYVLRWLARLDRTLKAAPEGIWLFNNGTLYVMAEDSDGEMVIDEHGSPDQDYILYEFSEMISEGGDF